MISDQHLLRLAVVLSLALGSLGTPVEPLQGPVCMKNKKGEQAVNHTSVSYMNCFDKDANTVLS